MRLALALACASLLAAACGPRENADEPAAGTEPAEARVPELASGSAIAPVNLLGLWNESAEACGQDNLTQVIISEREIRFYESGGSFTQVTERDGATVLATDMQGEGEAWQAEFTARLSSDGNALTLTLPSGPLTLVRC